VLLSSTPIRPVGYALLEPLHPAVGHRDRAGQVVLAPGDLAFVGAVEGHDFFFARDDQQVLGPDRAHAGAGRKLRARHPHFIAALGPGDHHQFLVFNIEDAITHLRRKLPGHL